MVYLIIVIFLSYVLLVVLLISGWQKTRSHALPPARQNNFITVVIPVRNEALTIATLLADLAQQRYTAFEVIVVDDHSVDTTAHVVQSFVLSNSKFRFLTNL